MSLSSTWLDVLSYNLINPAVLLTLQVLHTSYAIAFTKPFSILRVAIFPFHILCAYTTFNTARFYVHPTKLAPTAAGISYAICIHYLTTVVWFGWSVDNATGRLLMSRRPGPASKRPPTKTSPSTWTKLQSGFSGATGWRRLYTPQEAKNSPHFSSSNPLWTPSRIQFLTTAALKITLCYLVLDAADSVPPPPDFSSVFANARIPLLARLGSTSRDELIGRLISSFMFWANAYCYLQLITAAPAFLTVALGGPVAPWRPLFGSVAELYTVRGFWGAFWHQGIRYVLNDPAVFVAHDVLGLPRTGLVQRYLKVLLTFVGSGILHMIVDAVSGHALSETGLVMRFFVTQALGVVLEDAVQECWRRVSQRVLGWEQAKAMPLWKKLVGYVWIVAFLFWSTPAWFYPMARRAGEMRGTLKPFLPFSVVGMFVK